MGYWLTSVGVEWGNGLLVWGGWGNGSIVWGLGGAMGD